MRKQTKLVAVLSAATLLAVGASMTSFAATRGWNNLGDGDWEYLDSDGERVTNQWKKYGSDTFFLGEDGLMVRNQLIRPEDSSNNSDDYYYVDEVGRKVVNDWRKVVNEDDSYVNGQEVSVLYYYFGPNGKAYKADDSTTFKKKVINWAGKDRVFFFDEDAHMVSGWVQPENAPDDNYYYCGDETQGYAQIDWQLLEVPEFMKADAMQEDAYEDWELFCFDGNGKMRRAKERGEVKTWYDSGWYYTFDYYGVYQDDWYKVSIATENNGVASKSTADAYTTSMGIEQKAGWVYADTDDDGERDWYYLVKVSGNRNVPFNSFIEAGGSIPYGKRATSINKKVYIFDESGKMLDGLVTVKNTYTDDDGVVRHDGIEDELGGRRSVKLDSGLYYFSKDDATKGQMLKGKRSYTSDGETNYYYFANNSGKAYTATMIDNIIYGPTGKRIQAEDGNKYEIKEIDYVVKDKDGKVVINGSEAKPSKVIVSNTGKVATKGTRRRVEDSSYIVEIEADKTWKATLEPDKRNY